MRKNILMLILVVFCLTGLQAKYKIGLIDNDAVMADQKEVEYLKNELDEWMKLNRLTYEEDSERISKKYNQMAAPVMEKFNKKLFEYAEKRDFDFCFNLSSNAFMIVAEGEVTEDLTNYLKDSSYVPEKDNAYYTDLNLRFINSEFIKYDYIGVENYRKIYQLQSQYQQMMASGNNEEKESAEKMMMEFQAIENEINQKTENIMKVVAMLVNENKYDCIIDINGLNYAKEELEITNQVLEKLKSGIDLDNIEMRDVENKNSDICFIYSETLQSMIFEVQELEKLFVQNQRTKALNEQQWMAKEKELMDPILEKFNDYVLETAKENGYKLIIDKNLIYYSNPEDEITVKVADKYNEVPALSSAVKTDKIDEVKTILESLPSDKINETDKFGNTALIYAAGNREIIDLLLTKGADATHTNFDGHSAAFSAFIATGGISENVKYLIDQGAYVNSYLLSYAVQSLDPENVKYLLDKGADPNEMQDGRSPLMVAVMVANNSEDIKTISDVVKDLLASNGNPNLENEMGESALNLCNNDDIMKMLEEAN